jgi:hypothetical protein
VQLGQGKWSGRRDQHPHDEGGQTAAAVVSTEDGVSVPYEPVILVDQEVDATMRFAFGSVARANVVTTRWSSAETGLPGGPAT